MQAENKGGGGARKSPAIAQLRRAKLRLLEVGNAILMLRLRERQAELIERAVVEAFARAAYAVIERRGMAWARDTAPRLWRCRGSAARAKEVLEDSIRALLNAMADDIQHLRRSEDPVGPGPSRSRETAPLEGHEAGKTLV